MTQKEPEGLPREAVEAATRALNRIPPQDLAPETATAARVAIEAALPHLSNPLPDPVGAGPSDDAVQEAHEAYFADAPSPLEHACMKQALKAAYAIDRPASSTSALVGALERIALPTAHACAFSTAFEAAEFARQALAQHRESTDGEAE